MKIFFQENSPEKNSNHSCYIIISCFFSFVSCSHLPHQPVFFRPREIRRVCGPMIIDAGIFTEAACHRQIRNS